MSQLFLLLTRTSLTFQISMTWADEKKTIWKSSFPYRCPVFTVHIVAHPHISLLFLASCLFPSSPLTPALPPTLSSPSSHLTNLHLINPSWDRCWQHLRQSQRGGIIWHKLIQTQLLKDLGLSPLSPHVFSSFPNNHRTPNPNHHPPPRDANSSIFAVSRQRPSSLSAPPLFSPSSHLCPVCAITLAVANVSWQLLCLLSKGKCTKGSGNGSAKSTPCRDVAVATSSTKTHTPFHPVAPRSEQNTLQTQFSLIWQYPKQIRQ